MDMFRQQQQQTEMSTRNPSEVVKGTVRSPSREVKNKMRARVDTLEVISKARI